jgi:acyl-CoA thioester hydrolase
MSEPPFDANGTHQFRLRVYYEDTDAGGIVYHANYLRFAERARTELLRDLGVPHAALVADHGLMFVVRRIKLDYLRPARVDDSLRVLTRPVRVGAASAVLGQVIARQNEAPGELGEILMEAEIGLACIDGATGRPQRFPARWQLAFARGVRAAAKKE